MGVKHQKTRKEKIIADYRHQVYVLKNKDILPANPVPAMAFNENPYPAYPNSHVLKDVLKTGILTCSIVAAEIIFFFLLKNHVVILPIVKY